MFLFAFQPHQYTTYGAQRGVGRVKKVETKMSMSSEENEMSLESIARDERNKKIREGHRTVAAKLDREAVISL